MKLYRLLTADDDAAFCRKVTEALNEGWRLHGSPAYAFDAARGVMRCAQAVVKDKPGVYDPARPLREQ
ncbi:DUF1737 domain-containing protein [Oceanicella actignis]|uniref:DUF1737 domain-containing protein n=1 Tax=Oceanicella actignis TaxID=1189325 RepID=A0A1M7TAM2_9RHOB|nr:DUF1737 domain-containing protein [Oceanicella actignis]TYO89180.1 hypothetical protein LY05_01796 [Oceanicella actignis]SET52452.1 hypothetical protein SAMN04488119_105151 [Oceanicella actignis]SHN67733.1 hypothetical protein SAMN05216200_105150 [Oceanicella actignis]